MVENNRCKYPEVIFKQNKEGIYGVLPGAEAIA
jgi:hypothetical protein